MTSLLRKLPLRHRLLLALLPAHVRDEHEREIALDLQDGHAPSWSTLAADVLRAAPRAHFDVLQQDLRQAWRQFVRSPSFAFIAISTLALGLGGNLAFFTLVDGVLFTPSRLLGGDRLVTVNEENLARGQRSFGVSAGNFLDYTRDTTVFSASAAYQVRATTLHVGESYERVITAAVSGGFFDVFLEQPQLGRRLLPDDDVVGSDAVVVSDSFFTRRLGGDPSAVGSIIELDGRRLRVVGVMPRRFDFPFSSVEAWRPLAMPPDQWANRGARFLNTIARLRPEATVAMASQRLTRVSEDIAQSSPRTNDGWTVLVQDLIADGTDGVRDQLYLIWVAGTLVLLVAVANVAGLYIARAVTREREFAVRSSLGARTGRVARQAFTEALVLTLVGAGIGLALAALGLSWIRSEAAGAIPRLQEVQLGGRTISIGVAIALATAMALSALVVPTMRRGSVWGTLGAGRGGLTKGRWRILRLIVAGEVALACFVLIGSSLVTRSLRTLLDQPMGFESAGVVKFRVEAPFRFRTDVPMEQVIESQRGDRRRIWGALEPLLQQLGEESGVVAAGATNRLPLTGNWWVTSIGIPDRGAPDENRERAWIRPVTPGFLDAMRTPLVRGRAFDGSDRDGGERVVLVDEVFAQRVWGTADPVGREVVLDGPPTLPNRARVVGVVAAVRLNALDADPIGAVYTPFTQSLEGFFPNWGFDIVVRQSGPARIDPLLAERMRSLVRQHLPDAVLFSVSTMDEVVAASIADRRFHRLVLALLSGLSLVLSTVGVAGALALIVRERQRDLAIRRALGAGASRVWWEIQAGGLALAGAGAFVGIAVTLAGASVFASLVYGVSVRDPASFLVGPLALCAAAFLATSIPATRALRVNPTSALRDS